MFGMFGQKIRDRQRQVRGQLAHKGKNAWVTSRTRRGGGVGGVGGCGGGVGDSGV